MKRNAAKVTVHGQPRTWIGVNFWSRVGGPLMWGRYDGDVVQSELETMRDHGMTLTRSFFYWPELMPTPDALDEVLVERFRDFLDRHHALGMTTIPTFLVGHMSGENWDPAWRNGRDLFADVWFVARQAWYVRELTSRFADHPAVAGWLLTNEVPIYDDWRNRGIGTDRSQRASEIISWAQILIDAVRAGGGTQAVSIGEGACGVEVTGSDNGFRVREISPLVDFLGPHVYRMETDPVRQHLGAAFVCELLDLDGQPVVMEEFGLTSDYTSEANAAHYYRQVLHTTLLAGATGWITWNNTDYDDLWDQAPYSHHPFEMHFGITDRAGAPKPALLELQEFSKVLADVDLTRTRRVETDAALVVSSFLETEYPFTRPADRALIFRSLRQAYVAAREADLPLAFVREADGLGDADTDDLAALYLLPSTRQLLAPTWEWLRARAEAGATVYASLCAGDEPVQRGAWVPDLPGTFGVEHRLRYGLVEPIVEDVVEITVVRGFGTLRAGEVLRVRAGGTADSRSYLPVTAVGADVIAVDGHGNPVLLERRLGAGRTVLCTYPLENMAAHLARVNPESTWRLYDALAEVAGARRSVRVHDPRVFCDVLVREDGERFAWFVSQHEEEVVIDVESGTPLLDRTSGEDLGGKVRLPPFGVVVARLSGLGRSVDDSEVA